MKNKRGLSLGLAAVLAVSVCGCGESTQTVKEAAGKTLEDTKEETTQAAGIAEEAAGRSTDKEAEKEETVYVNADASGSVKEITVSAWLKNGSGLSELTDVTNLTDVVNVKGDETFTQDKDTYVWAAGGKDIYYQGLTSEALPVDVKVTYYLDDQKIDPKELAGKSGKVRIRFDYENHSRQRRTIGGEEAELCVPFVAASTLILDSDRFVNVEVENGKILSDGKNTIVAGVAMPGLYDSLDLLNLEGFEDVDIPEYVEVAADVTDFQLSMTATVLMPDVFGRLDTDDMDGFDDLKEDIEELNDATYDLIDGCIELDDGVLELKDHMPDLWEGVTELDDGATELNDGAWELYNGSRDLYDGADQLNEGARGIREGAKGLDEGTKSLQAGAGILNDSMPKFTGGVDQLAAGLQSIQDPMMLGPDGKSGDEEHPYIKTSVGLLKDGVDQLADRVDGMGDALEQAIAENEKKMQEAQTEVILQKSNLEQAVQEAAALQDELTELAKQMGLVTSGNRSGQMPAAEDEPALAESDAATGQKPSADAAQAEGAKAVLEDEDQPDPAPEDEKKSSEIADDEKDSMISPEDGTGPTAGSDSGKEPAESPEGGKESASAPEGVKEPTESPEDGKESTPGSDSGEEPTESPEGGKESAPGPDSGEEPAESPEGGKESAPAPEGVKEPTESPEDGKESTPGSDGAPASPEDEKESLSDLTEYRGATDAAQGSSKEEPACVLPENIEGRISETPAMQREAEEKPKGTEEGRSEFAQSYLESFGESDGMTSMGMAQMKDAGSGISISDPAAVIEGYKKVVAIQTDLIQKLNEITKLQEGLREAATDYAGFVGADTALKQVAGQMGRSDSAQQLEQLTQGMASLEVSIGQLYDGVALINSQMETLTGGAAQLQQGVGSLKNGADALKTGTEKLYQGGVDLKNGAKELYDGTEELRDGAEELKDGTQELKDGTVELKDGVVDLVDGVDELKDGTKELLDGVYEYNDDGIQKLYDMVNVDLQNLMDRVDAISDLSKSYQSFSGKSDGMEGSVKFIIETEAIELEEDA